MPSNIDAGGANANSVQVTREVTLDASPAKVWETIGPFSALADWHPAFASCSETEQGGGVGRRLTTKDGAVILEKLLDHSDRGMSYTYSILESPLPIENYESTLSVADAGGGKAKVTWTSTFVTNGISKADAEKVIGGIYDAGLGALRNTVE